MRLKRLKTEQLKPYKNNPRLNDEAVPAVIESIKQCGYIAPIIVDENYEILAGHTRLKALQQMGIEEAECIVREGLTEEQKKKYRILDNKTNEIAEWDLEKLEIELQSLDFCGFDFQFEGIDFSPAAEIEDYDIIEDEVPEVDEENEPVTKYGDVWQLGRHRVMCGNSTKQEDVAKLMNGVQADLFLTDPPYNVAYEGGTEDRLTIMNDSMKDAEFKEFLKQSFQIAKDGMKDGAAFYIWHADSEGYNFRGALKEAGLQTRQCLIWKKNSLVLGRQDYHWQHEPCLYGWKDGASHSWYSDRKQTTVLEFDKPQRNGEHPTMKPVALFDYLIRNSTKHNDVVLDLFNGSGTSIIACEQNNRTAYTMELDPKYVDVTIRRYENLTGEKAVRVSV